jgi:GDPmannose 4,6-dehydratase
VTRKVTLAAARIKAGLQQSVSLGDLDSARDWGYAKDFVHAMWLMMQQDTPDDYVLATGESHTVRDLLTTAFSYVGLNWEDFVRTDERFRRPSDARDLLGEPRKAKTQLKWKPTVTFEELIHLMVDHDQQHIKRISK